MANELHKELKPNDVAVILRPTVDDDGKWMGEYEVLVTGFGPVTLTRTEMDDMVGMGVLLASVVPLMAKDEKVAEIIMDHCNDFYGDIGTFSYDPDFDSFKDGQALTPDTKVVGGMQ
jgi:hypothetical protein